MVRYLLPHASRAYSHIFLGVLYFTCVPEAYMSRGAPPLTFRQNPDHPEHPASELLPAISAFKAVARHDPCTHISQILDNNVYTSGNSSDISVLNEPVTAILISRFLIDLQEANIQSMHQDSLASVGTLNFDRVVGSASFCLSVPAEVPGISTQEHGSAAQAVEAEPGVEPEIIEVDRSLGEA
ncbi:hypothetical protein L227DRAFT_7211 [Lentinus tigrinus ALCF2SS1-6]|uniref:Uncharacterized protein n=1 Tax=Lentinus tigrinus ALCF2SS1-6 TaxID=1328759 RepID=A0A5C2SSK2_9APHY|nr:hypothetical protein L227DRAFT_7211 [Lentinus tigrinus ALCF2SS1-6]